MDEAIKGLVDTYGIWLFTLIVLAVTTVLVALIGLERERKGFSAGLRTHLLVGIGSCILMVVSEYANPETSDTMRLAAQVVVGIGFIGAGVIIQTGLDVKGLTTAATLWVSSAIGLCTGAGLVLEAIITTLVVMFVLIVLKQVENRVTRNRARISYVVPLGQKTLEQVSAACEKLNVEVADIDTSNEKYKNEVCTKIIITVRINDKSQLGKIMDEINDDIKPLALEEIK